MIQFATMLTTASALMTVAGYAMALVAFTHVDATRFPPGTATVMATSLTHWVYVVEIALLTQTKMAFAIQKTTVLDP